MQNLASQRGGKCISDKYLGAMEKIHWRCLKGHHWFATPKYLFPVSTELT